MSEIAFSHLGGARFLYSGRVQAENAWRMHAHQHITHEIIIVLRGELTAQLPGETLRAAAGTILLYPAGCVHEEWSATSATLETAFISFAWPDLPTDIPRCLPDAQGRVQALMTWLLQEREAYFPEADQFLHTMLRALLAEYIRLAAHRGNKMVERIRAHIRAHLTESLTLDALAAVAGMSRYHFIRTYREHTGLTPMRDLCRIRLEAARQLLLTTRMPLKSIAPRVGFANEYHLSRMLKKRLAMSARELRSRTQLPDREFPS